jgi:hypothetical protein
MAGVFKSLDQSDVRITPFRTYKLWNQSVGYTTYAAPATSANQTQRLFSKVFGVNYAASSSALYALEDYYQATSTDYAQNAELNVPTNTQLGGTLYKFVYQLDGTYNYITNLSQAYGSTINIVHPNHVVTTSQTTIPAIAVFQSSSNTLYGLKGDLTDAWLGVSKEIPSASLPDQTVHSMDIGFRGASNLNLFFGTTYGLYLLACTSSNFSLASTTIAPISSEPFSGSYIGVLGSKTTLTQTIGLQIDVNDPAYPILSPGALRFIQFAGYNSVTAAPTAPVTHSIIEPTTRYSGGGVGSTRTMEAHNNCVYALMHDDRLYMIITGSGIIAPVSTYIDGVAEVVSTRSADRTTNLNGESLPTHKVHIITRDGNIIVNPLPRKSGTDVVYDNSDVIDCRQYVGANKTIRSVTNLKNTTNENIFIIAGNSGSFDETVSFVVDPNTHEISNVTHFGSLKADQIVTCGSDLNAVFGTKKELTPSNTFYADFQILYTSSLQGANTTKWYKFDM